MEKVLSNGMSDGLIMLYIKGGKVHPVALSRDQVDMLECMLTMALQPQLVVIKDPVLVDGVALTVKNMGREVAADD